MHDFRGFLVGCVKRAHTAQIAGRKALGRGIGRLQVFRRRDSRSFFAPAANHSTDLTVQLHLRELRRHKRVQFYKQCTVVCGFADVHGFSSYIVVILGILYDFTPRMHVHESKSAGRLINRTVLHLQLCSRRAIL